MTNPHDNLNNFEKCKKKSKTENHINNAKKRINTQHYKPI